MKTRVILIVIFAGFFIFSCTKLENEFSEQKTVSSPTKSAISSNDAFLLSVLNNNGLDSYDKGSVFLDQDSLSELVIDSLLSLSIGFDPYVIELILTSQISLTEHSLRSIIDCNYITTPTLLNILYSKTPLSANIEDYLYQKRQTNINSSYDNYEKIISVCGGGVIYAEKIIEVRDCSTTSFALINPIQRSFNCICNCNDQNINKLFESTGGGKWIRGESTVKVGDGITWISCKTPPSPKCMKRISTKTNTFPQDNGIMNFLNSNTSDYIKGKRLLSEDSLSEYVLLEIINRACYFDKFVTEIVFLNQEQLSDKVIYSLILSPNISDDMLTNILIVNTPLNSKAIELASKVRPNVNVGEINSYSNKKILLSLCSRSLIIGDEIIITTNMNSTSFQVFNIERKYFTSSISDNNLKFLVSGASADKWILGEEAVVVPRPESTTIACTRPPNTKCVKIKK